jgi:hypothetical protein
MSRSLSLASEEAPSAEELAITERDEVAFERIPNRRGLC